MPKKKRRKFSSEFKAKIGLQAIQGFNTIGAIASENNLHPTQVAKWKKELQDRLPEVFETPGRSPDDRDELIEDLYSKIGKLTVELEWLQKKAKALGL